MFSTVISIILVLTVTIRQEVASFSANVEAQSRMTSFTSLGVSTPPRRTSRRPNSFIDDRDGNDDDVDKRRKSFSGGPPQRTTNFNSNNSRGNSNSRSNEGGYNNNNNENNKNGNQRSSRYSNNNNNRSDISNSNTPRNSRQQNRVVPPPTIQEEEITDTNAHFFSKKSLSDPSFHPVLDTANDQEKAIEERFQSLCRGAGISRPSRIQSLAWPAIMSGKHTIVADQTGSGKTLAYLLPLLQRALSSPSISTNGAPKALILAPTAELADQIRSVCARISESVPFKMMVVTANGKFTTSIRDQIRIIQRQPIDVLISTPGRVSTILRTRNSGLDLSNLQTIVLDEVDILMIDETFGPQLRTVGAEAPIGETQFVFVTATLPDSIVKKIELEFPGVEQVRGPGLHRLAPSLTEHLVDVSVPADQNRNEDMCFDIKAKQLLKALRQNRCRRTLIFCNTVDSCRTVENLLNRKDRRGRVFEVLAYHNAMTPEARNDNLSFFSKGRKGLTGNKGGEDDDVDYILICTDRAARGVDFDSSPVDHAVIFDFPKDPAEYIRRVGRTARAGRTGTTTVFAYGWQLPIARKAMGSKLDSFTIAADDMTDKEEDFDFRTNRRTKKTKDAVVKAKIESGQLWEE
jgi:ATP-dependent RNA helicase DDX18/HAS1